MGRRLVAFVLLGLVGCPSPAPGSKQPRRTQTRPPSDATEIAELAPPSRDALRAIFADRLELTEVHGPEVYADESITRGFLFCATARSPGSLDVGLRDPRDPASVGRVSVEIRARGEARAVGLTGGAAVLSVGDELCLLAPPADPPWEWFRPDPERLEQSPTVELGPLGPADGATHERAAALAPPLVDPRRIRVGDEEGFSQVRFTAAEEGDRYCGAFLSVTASRAEPVRVGAWMFPPHGALGPVQLRPGDTLTLWRDALMPGEPIPSLLGL